jgi:hypothetical protein
MATSRAPPCTRACPVSTCTFTHWGSPCASATPRSTHGRSSMGRPHQRRVVVAAPAPAPITSRTPSPLSCATRRVSTPRGVHGLPGGVQAPGAVEPRPRQGRVPPPPPQAHFVEHLGCPRKTVGDLGTPGDTRGGDRDRSARIRCGPPLVPQPHDDPHGTQPHRQPRIPCGWPVTGQPPRGPQGSRPHPRSGDPVRLALLRGVFDLFKFQKMVICFEKS